ncbi:hypothetical protein TSL1_04020 [Sulfurovum sp. TSL1]|nr:hypothetical protein TSL1_04020 [Sulfurovum sp. TSL1]
MKTLNIKNILLAGTVSVGGNDDYVYDSPNNYKRKIKCLKRLQLF